MNTATITFTKKSPLVALFCLLVLAVLMTSCRSNKVQSIQHTDGSTVQRLNRFSLTLFREVCDHEDPYANVFLSPMSADIALSMAEQGAKGKTRSEMQKWLVPLRWENNEQLRIANSLWIDPAFPVKASYIEACKPFGAEVYNATIQPAIVNRWVSEKTDGKISSILPETMPANQSMVLINALYFKAEWLRRFDEGATRSELFYPTEGKSYEVPLMHLTHVLGYKQTNKAQIVELPYRDCDYVMDVILPAQGYSLRDVSESLNDKEWNGLSEFVRTRVALTMPKFKIEYQRTLNEDLQGLGIKNAFAPQADFSLMSDVATRISTVLQKTYLDVNEIGTEAAAATAVIMVRGAAHLAEPVEMTVDRPFLVLIRNRETGIIVFIGKIERV